VAIRNSRGVVVHILASLNRGGAESVTLDLIRATAASGFENIVVCLTGRAGDLLREYEEANARVILIDFWENPVVALCRLGSLARSENVNAVISNLSLPSGVFLLPFMMMKVPIRIARIHSDSDGRGDIAVVRMKRRVLRSFLRWTSTKILAVNEEALAFGGAVGDVLPNGVRTEKFEFCEREGLHSFRVINVGRPDPAKNRKRLLSLSKELISIGVDPIRVVGREGTDVGLGDAPTIDFVGPVNDVVSEYKAADCLVVTSIREGLPGVVLEALSCGVPVVSSDLPGVRTVSASLPGITVLDLEQPDHDWAQAILQACKSRRTGFSAEVAAALRASQYSLELVNVRWLTELGG